jgi:hypothetical protein
MKALKAACAFSLVLSWSGAALAQDPVKVDSAHYKVLLENASVRVLRVDYPAGAKSPMHQHPDNMVIALSSAKVKFTAPDGKTQDADLTNESALYDAAGSHSGAIVGGGPVNAVIVEFKAPKPGTAAIPTSRQGMGMKVLADGARAVAYRSTADPTFSEPAGTKHDFDQVVVALGDSQMSLSIDGKPAKTKWARGDVQFIGRGVGHESKNTGGKPVDFIIVAIK